MPESAKSITAQGRPPPNGTIFLVLSKKDMTNLISNNIESLDTAVKNKLGGNSFTLSPKIEQLFKWIPYISTLISDFQQSEVRKKLMTRLQTVALSETIVNGVLDPLKKIIHRQRPDSTTQFDSFPSAHTATSFMGAEILRQASKDKMPALAYSGYIMAIATTALRVHNKKSWLSDVVAGAALGIASAGVACWLVKEHNRKKAMEI